MLAARNGAPRWGLPILILVCAGGLSHIHAADQPDPTIEKQYLDLLNERDQISRSVKILQDEVQLSDGKRLYLVMDFREKSIFLKVHGLPLKQIPLLELRKLGKLDCSTGPAVVEQIESPSTTSASVPGEADPERRVEVADMPLSYELHFGPEEHPVTVSVHSAPTTLVARTWLRFSAAMQSGGYAVLQTAGFSRPSYRVLVSPEDAQSLFWSIEKGCPAILVCD